MIANFLPSSIQTAAKGRIETAFKLCKYTQSNFNALHNSVQYLAYSFNRALTPDIDKLRQGLKNGDNPPPLPTNKQSLAKAFIECARSYLENLPCFKTKLAENEQKQIFVTLEAYINNREGAPLGVYEYVNKTTPAHLLDYLLDNFIFVKITHGGLSDIGYWNGETYLLGKDHFMALVMDVFELEYYKAGDKRYKTSYDEDELYKQLQQRIKETHELAGPEYIPCLNGILYLDRTNPQNIELKPFTPDIITTYQFQGNYYPDYRHAIPQETVKKLDAYLDLISNKNNDEQHHEELKTRALEFMATTLYRGQLFKKFGFVHGRADGGKTKFIIFVLSVIPTKYQSRIGLPRFHERFAIVNLDGKLVNFDDESHLSASINCANQDQDMIKKILSGDFIQSDDKNKRDIQFVPDARLIFASNRYLLLTQESTEVKMLYIPFMNKLNDKYRAFFPDVVNPKQDEKDYIFNTLIEYLQKVFDNFNARGEYFTQSDYIDALQEQAKTEADEAYELIKDFIEKGNPLKDYPRGKLLSDATLEKMRLTYYKSKFDAFLAKINSKLDVNIQTFRRHFLKLSNFQERNAKERRYKDHTYTVLLPKEYLTKKINSYNDYKKIIQSENEQRIKTAQAINDHTNQEYARVKVLNLDPVI